MSDHAARAIELIDVRLMALRRAPWEAQQGDCWTEVSDAQQAVQALGEAPRHVFLALGRQELAPFRQAPQHHYLIRSVDPVTPPLAVPHATYITARGPFEEADELVLLKQHEIDVIVCKNSGGDASYGKIAAARMLGREVIMIARPKLPDFPSVDTIDEVLHWLDHAVAS
jgi:precorrin-6A/cobalt-precorrin-6A reductase